MVKFIEMDKLGSEFLKDRYGNPPLANTNEVTAASRNLRSNDPVARIQKYLDRLEDVAGDPQNKGRKVEIGGESRPRGLSLLREMVVDTYVRPQKEKLAENAAAVEERAARELGHGDIEYDERTLAERGNIAVKDLENSLDNWILYLSDKNEPYPTWFRYYTFRNVLSLGRYDKDKNEFPKRSSGTNLLFPDIDRSALGHIQDMIEASRDQSSLDKLRSAQQKLGTPGSELITKDKAVTFAKLPFAKQYTEAIQLKGEITPEMRAQTQGGWARFPQGQDPAEYQPVIKVDGKDYVGKPLWQSLQNKGVPWCTAGLGTAQTQLQGGDFYVYYTLDRQGKPTIPRIAIRMDGTTENGQIGEVRGVADNAQNLEGNMADIAEVQMDHLPGGDRYRKISADMKKMTFLTWKNTLKEEDLNNPKTLRRLQEESLRLFGTSDSALQFSKSQLIFLYEIDSKIEGFGYQRDPRIEELRTSRNPKVDAPIVLECRPDEIATSQSEITRNTRAYIGEPFPGIFKLLPADKIYKSFPEDRAKGGETVTLQRTDAKKVRKKWERQGNRGTDYALYMVDKADLGKQGNYEVIRIPCSFLMKKTDTRGYLETTEVLERAKALGLLDEDTPPGVILNYALQHGDKITNGDWFYSVGMKPIAGPDGRPHVFSVERGGDGELWLLVSWTEPDRRWRSDYELVFALRK